MFNLFKSNKLSSVITVIDIGSSKITCLIAKINEQNQEYEVIGNSQNISNETQCLNTFFIFSQTTL